VKSFLRNIPPYAWLLALLPALRVFAGNVDRLAVSWFFLCLAVTAAIYFIGRAILRLTVSDRELAELLWAILYMCVMAAGFFFPAKGSEHWWIGLCLALAIAVTMIASWRRIAGRVLTIFAGTGCAVPVVLMLVSPVWLERPAIRQLAATAFGELPQRTIGTEADKRDIYYLIFDRYARADQLRDIYGYDNELFIRELESRGFAVAEQSFANYQRTTHSLISSLNLDYLKGLDREPASSSHDWLPLYEMLQDFRLRRFLDAQGYDFHFFGSWWEPTRVNRLAHQNHNWLAIPEPFRAMLDQSLIPFFSKLAGAEIFDHRLVQCQRSKQAFAELRNLTQKPQAPKFVFAHFLVPHPPFVMDESGRCISAEEAKAHSRAQNYIRQVAYTNREILKFLDVAMNRPGPKPIIIIQSDEGPWPQRFAGDEITALGADVTPADWRKATRAELVEKMAILNALYLPDRDMSDIEETASPVNSFRLVLRKYFGIPLEPLPDRQIIFESAERLYRFHDVTESLSAEVTSHPPRKRTGMRPALD
jgi:Sulfatase